jgi:transposase
VRRLWERGCRTAKQIFAEIRKLGYVGGYSSLTRLLRSLREAKPAAAKTAAPPAEETSAAVPVLRHISSHVAAALLSKPRPQLSSKQREIVDHLKSQCPGFAAMRHLVLSFRSILCFGKASSLESWAEKAEATGIEALSRFVVRLKQDWSAVVNAVEQAWSNGPAEGHINRLKTLKRQMYGRADFPLLRARTLPLAA